jgi:hypothetical protein
MEAFASGGASPAGRLRRLKNLLKEVLKNLQNFLSLASLEAVRMQ